MAEHDDEVRPRRGYLPEDDETESSSEFFGSRALGWADGEDDGDEADAFDTDHADEPSDEVRLGRAAVDDEPVTAATPDPATEQPAAVSAAPTTESAPDAGATVTDDPVTDEDAGTNRRPLILGAVAVGVAILLIAILAMQSCSSSGTAAPSAAPSAKQTLVRTLNPKTARFKKADTAHMPEKIEVFERDHKRDASPSQSAQDRAFYTDPKNPKAELAAFALLGDYESIEKWASHPALKESKVDGEVACGRLGEMPTCAMMLHGGLLQLTNRSNDLPLDRLKAMTKKVYEAQP